MTSSRDDEKFLEELAEAILDGKTAPVASDAACDEEHAAALRQADILARIAHIHQNLPDDDTALGSVESGSVPLSWGRLTILEELGRGTFGAVYRARDSRLDRDVALKLLWPGKTDPDRFINSMVEEGRLLAQVHHPNVVSIYDANVIDGRVGLTMEFVRGQTLAQEFQARGPFSVRDVVLVGREMARALAAVHEAGLLHRDVKTHNVMRRTDGRLVLMDFGAGRRTDRGDGENAAITGTPLYLAPEVLEGYRATVQSDIYSLGVLLFYLLSGKYPVSGQTIRELRDAHHQRRRESLTSARTDVPDGLASIVNRALAPVASERWGSANEMANALAAIEGAARPPWKRHAITAIGVTALLIAASVFLLTRRELSDSQDLTIQRMDMPDSFLSVAGISSDGRYLAYLAGEGTRLMMRDVTSGEDWELRGAAQNDPGAIEWAAISRDNAHVAYSWESEAARELRIVDIRGRMARTLLRDATPEGSSFGTTLMPVDWMPDDSAVLVLRTRPGGTHDIALVDVAGMVRTLKNGLDWPVTMRLSLDGRFVAYDHPIPSQSDARDISILSTETGAETRIVTDAAQDALPVWIPGDRGIMFASDRSGTFGLWMVPLSAGRPTGPAALIKKDIGRIQSMTLTRDGELFHALQSGEVDVYVATLAPDGTIVPGSVTRAAASYLGSNMDPEWLPDGRSLAYVSRRRTLGPRRHALVVRDMDAGSEQALWPDLNGFVEPRWSPDGSRVLVRGGDRNGTPGPWLLNPTTGAVMSRVSADMGWDLEWADGRSLLAFNGKFVGRFDVDTGAAQELYRDASGRRPTGVAGTPDGRFMALTLDSQKTRTLLVLPAGGGPAQEIFSASEPNGFLLQGFTRDGAHVLVSRWGPATSLPDRQWSLWRVAVAGGAPQPMNVSGYDLRGVTVSPDGTRIAYRTGEPEWDYWTMRNFLPKEGSE